MIKIENISKTFCDSSRGEIEAVLPTSLEVEKGEIFGLLGPNGAGKTTLLRMLSTVLTPTSGTAWINGFELKKDPENIKKSIGFLSGNTKPYGRLTPRELLNYFGALYDMTKRDIREKSEKIFELLDMNEFVNQRIDKLSTGMTQKTSISRCLLHDPPVLVLDEPTLGLDILTGKTIIEFIRTSAKNGKTIIFSTHYMTEAELLCDRIGLLHKGKLIDVDTLQKYKEKTGKTNLSDIFMTKIEEKMETIDEH